MVGSPGRLPLVSEVFVMVLRSLAFARLCAARCGGPAPVVPGSCFPAFVAGGVPPLSCSVRWGVVLGGAPASWRPGPVLSGVDCDFLSASESLAHSDGSDAWEWSDCSCGVPPSVVCFWVLPSGAAVVASVCPARVGVLSGVAC